MAGIEVKDLSKDKESKGSHKKLLIIILVVLVIVACAVGGYLYYKHTHKPKPQPVKTMANYKEGKLYESLNNNQKLNFRLNIVGQYLAVNAYQKMLDELNQISIDIPGSQDNISFLAYQFIANYDLQKEQDAIASAKKIKATNQALPVEFTPWKGRIDQYAAK